MENLLLALVTFCVIFLLRLRSKIAIVTSQKNMVVYLMDTKLAVSIDEKESQKELFKKWVIKVSNGFKLVLNSSNAMKNSLKITIWIQNGDYP